MFLVQNLFHKSWIAIFHILQLLAQAIHFDHPDAFLKLSTLEITDKLMARVCRLITFPNNFGNLAPYFLCLFHTCLRLWTQFKHMLEIILLRILRSFPFDPSICCRWQLQLTLLCLFKLLLLLHLLLILFIAPHDAMLGYFCLVKCLQSIRYSRHKFTALIIFVREIGVSNLQFFHLFHSLFSIKGAIKFLIDTKNFLST